MPLDHAEGEGVPVYFDGFFLSAMYFDHIVPSTGQIFKILIQT